jgi:hypothetical protein
MKMIERLPKQYPGYIMSNHLIESFGCTHGKLSIKECQQFHVLEVWKFNIDLVLVIHSQILGHLCMKQL